MTGGVFKNQYGVTGQPVASGNMTIALNQYYQLGAKAKGANIWVYINGEQKATFTDPAPYSFTGVGFMTRNAVALFDDTKLEGLPDANTTYYRYNEVTGALMHELDANGNITVSYVSDSSGRIISVTRAQNTQYPTTFFYHYNAHGDVTAITGSNGSIVASFSYDAWGVPTEKDANGNPVALIGTWTQTTGGTPGNGLFILFGGMLYDAAAGLYLTKIRAYNPRTGRFLERDILDESGKNGVYAGFPFGKDAIGTNLYAWCGNNPINRVDPSGLSFFSDAINRVREAASSAIDWVSNQASNTWNSFKSRFWRTATSAKQRVVTTVTRAVSTMASTINSAVANIRNSFMNQVSNTWATATAKIPAPIRQEMIHTATRQDYETPDYYSGVKAGAVAVYGHYTSDEKSSSLENLGYDVVGMTNPYVAGVVLLPSLANTRRDYNNCYIDGKRAAFNISMDIIGLRSPIGSGASAFANGMDYADERGWLDPVNDFLSW